MKNKNSLHFEFKSKIKHPEELITYKRHLIFFYNPLEFDVEANKQEQQSIQALIKELTNNDINNFLIDCLPIAITNDAHHFINLGQENTLF